MTDMTLTELGRTFHSIARSLERIADHLENKQQVHGLPAVEVKSSPAEEKSVAPAPAPTEAEKPKRKRGRPRKVKPETEAPPVEVKAEAPPQVTHAAPEAEPAAPAPAVTLDTIKTKLADLTQNDPTALDRIREALAGMGVGRVSELEPDDYESFLLRVGAGEDADDGLGGML